jgi:hypothetical protein
LHWERRIGTAYCDELDEVMIIPYKEAPVVLFQILALYSNRDRSMLLNANAKCLVETQTPNTHPASYIIVCFWPTLTPNLSLCALSFTTPPSWPTPPSSQTRPHSIHPCSHISQFPLQARLYLRQSPRRRDNGVGSGRRTGSRGRGNACIVLQSLAFHVSVSD